MSGSEKELKNFSTLELEDTVDNQNNFHPRIENKIQVSNIGYALVKEYDILSVFLINWYMTKKRLIISL